MSGVPLRAMTRSEVERWYKTELTEAFPPTECKPLEEILALLAEGCYEVLGLFDPGGTLLGYATLLQRPAARYLLLDYLGITAARRGGGLGSELLRHLARSCADRPGILTEAEAPIPGGPEAENRLRQRRIAFYQRCGFAPIYQMATCGLCFQAMLLGEVPADLTPVMADHRVLYGSLRTDVKIPLSPGETPEPPHWIKNMR